jgi:acyl carrier protein
MITTEVVHEICQRLGFLDGNGALRRLDSLEQLDIILEAESRFGLSVPSTELRPELFASLETITAFLVGLTPSA